jgi:ankyrin repeat protein
MKDKEKLSALDYACKFGNFDLADLLIELTPPIELSSNKDNLPLPSHYAVSNKIENHRKMIRTVTKMLEKIRISGTNQILSQSLSAKDHNGDTLLHISIKNNYLELTQLLIEKYNNRINVTAGGMEKNLPIHLAAEIGSKEIFDLLVKYKSKINATNARNENCLHIAAMSNKSQFIQHFLKIEREIFGENFCCKGTNLFQFTPLMSAAYAGSLECVKILTGPDIFYDLMYTDIDDHCIFHLCAKKNNLECLRYLFDNISKDASLLNNILEQKDKYDNTLLHVVCLNGYNEMFDYLLKKITDNQNLIFRKNSSEETCFHLCCKEGHERIAK